MIFYQHKLAVMVCPIVFFFLVLTGCQKTQDEVSQESTETVEVYNRDNLPSELQELIDQGDAQAQTDLGSMYYQGTGVQQDYAKAVELYEKAASQGFADAQNGIGAMYTKGSGVRQDYAKAAQWYEKAANQGFAFAQSNLGTMYYEGKGVRQNMATAKEWFGKACDNDLQAGCDKYREINQR